MKIAKRLYFAAAILLLLSNCSTSQPPQPAPIPTAPQDNVSQMMKLPGEAPQPPQAAATPAPQPAPVPPPVIINPDAKYKIGLLAPLTGGAAHIGKQIVDAAQLAILESGTKDFQILPFDTAAGADAAADQALAQHVSIILGPVFSNEVVPVAIKAKAANVKVISFSNNRTVANGNVYILGLVPSEQLNRIIKYAGDNGIKGFSTFLPANEFGAQLEKTAKRLASAAHVNIVKNQTYSSDYDSAARELSEAFAKKSITLDRRSQGLLVAEGGDKLPAILASLDKLGISTNSMRIMGTSFWDHEDIITNPLTDGAWFVSTPYEGQDAFSTRFNEHYSYKPEDIAALGYDAVNLAMETIGNNYTDSDLKRSSGFKGVKGIYKFNKDNVDVRGYAIYEIQNGGAHVIDAAPDHF